MAAILKQEMHRHLCNNLIHNLSEESDRALFHALCREEVGEITMDPALTIPQMLSLLEERGIFGIGNYDKVCCILNKMQMKSLADNLIGKDDVQIDEADDLSKKCMEEILDLEDQEEEEKEADKVVDPPPAGKVQRQDKYPSGPTLVAIFNQFTWSREGTIRDEKQILKYFGGESSYACFIFQNCTRDVMLMKLIQLQNEINIDTSHYKRLFVFILSHGDQNGIKTCRDDGITWDGNYIKTREILEIFRTDNIPKLEGCPKVFIMQACRGSDVQPGVQRWEDQEPGLIPRGPEEEMKSGTVKLTTPVDADVLLVYSQTKGYVSIRHAYYGSWFISDLIEIFKSHKKTDHLLDILTLVNSKVADRVTLYGEKQMPCLVSTLRRKLYL